MYTMALTLLHDPTTTEFRNPSMETYALTFTQGPDASKSVTAFQLIALIQRAQIYILQSVYSASGYDFVSSPDKSGPPFILSSTPYSAEFPPAPMGLVQNTVFPFALYAASLNVLMALSPRGGGGGGGSSSSSSLGSSAIHFGALTNLDGPLSCMSGIQKWVIPVLSNLARVWRVSEVYIKCLQDLVEEVNTILSGNVIEQPGKAYRESFVPLKSKPPFFEVCFLCLGPSSFKLIGGLLFFVRCQRGAKVVGKKVSVGEHKIMHGVVLTVTFTCSGQPEGCNLVDALAGAISGKSV
jgi:hypothetical protein